MEATGTSIETPLTAVPGDAARGRAIVVNTRLGLCLLCHSGPFSDAPVQGNIAPSLAGAGARWTIAQLRARIVDARTFNPDTIMPPYYVIDGQTNVAPAFKGKPVLTAQQVEDVVAFLAELRSTP